MNRPLINRPLINQKPINRKPIRTSILSLATLVGTLATLAVHAPQALAFLLVGNTKTSNVVIYDEQTGSFGGDFIPAFSGWESPDDLTFGPDGNLYVSYISSAGDFSGGIFRFDGITGAPLGRFDRGGDLKRPYGLAFGPDGYLYASSFRSDQILRFDGKTGDYIDVFATGTGMADGLNGPNDLLFDSDGTLYVTTQGSVADDKGNIDFKFDSQVLRYSVTEPDKPSVFIPQPKPSPDSVGFVSFLGLAFGPSGDLFVSDFANDIRRYDRYTGKLLDTLSTNYTGTSPSNNFIGNLAFAPNNDLFTVGFDGTQENIGAILRFDGITGDPLPGPGLDQAIFIGPTADLQRPIGVAYKATPVPEPSTILASAAGIGLVTRLLKLRQQRKTS